MIYRYIILIIIMQQKLLTKYTIGMETLLEFFELLKSMQKTSFRI